MQLDNPKLDCAEFLESLADTEAGEGRDVNADAFRQRADEVKRLQREHQELTDRNQALEQQLDRARAAVAPMAK